MRYVGQVHECTVDIGTFEINAKSIEKVKDAFHKRHEELYTYSERHNAVEVVNIESTLFGRIDKPKAPKLAAGGPAAKALKGYRKAIFEASGKATRTPIYDGGKLGAGASLAGPAIIEEVTTTIVIEPGWTRQARCQRVLRDHAEKEIGRSMVPSLAADNVSVSFEGLRALSNVSLDVPREKVTGLIGPNGAGKTTLVNVLTGFQKPTDGRVLMDGKDIGGTPPHKIRHLGIARTFQSGRLFGDLAVIDNLEVTGVGLGLTRRAADCQGRSHAGLDRDFAPDRPRWPVACRIRTSAASPLAAP